MANFNANGQTFTVVIGQRLKIIIIYPSGHTDVYMYIG